MAFQIDIYSSFVASRYLVADYKIYTTYPIFLVFSLSTPNGVFLERRYLYLKYSDVFTVKTKN